MKFLQFFALSQSFSVASARLKLGARARAMEQTNQVTDDSNYNSPVDNNRIIGGKEAVAGKFSYVVSLADDIGHFCGGSLIAPDIVLTAAHCQGGSYNIVVGRQDLNDERSGEVIPMDFEMPHPKYNDMTTDNDFNLVFLSRPVSAKNLKLVTLNNEDDMPAVGDSVHVSGWGDTAKEDDIQTLSNALMTVELKVISNDECSASKGSIGGFDETYNGQITPNMMCAKDPNQDACQGDSGGPLVVQGHRGPDGSDDVQVGVVSWGVGCAQASFPGVYSRVSKAYEWIKEEVCTRSADPPASFKCEPPPMTSGSTADNTVSEASAFVLSYQSMSGFRSNEVEIWSTLVEDDFSYGFNFFNTGSTDITLYKSAKGRSGVVRLSKGASISSKMITDTSDAIRVFLSFYYIDIEDGLGLCLDYSDDKGVSWRESACFRGGSTFTNGVWYDSMSAEIRPPEQIESLMIRLRSSGSQGDVLVDKVVVQGFNQ